jgi:c-di-GMP-binding flagellar brake protein YcgR
MALGWILIVGFIVFVLLLLAKDEYYDRREKKKRLELRAEIEWPVTITTEGEVLQGRTVNISASGALLCGVEQLSLNDIVRLNINPPIRAQLEITAEVVRTEVQCSEEEDTPHGVAVRFIIISEKDRQFISFSVYDHIQGERFPEDSLFSPANPSQKARTLRPNSGR